MPVTNEQLTFPKYPTMPKEKRKKIPNCQAFPKRNGRHPNLVPFSYGGKAVLHKTDSVEETGNSYVVFQ